MKPIPDERLRELRDVENALITRYGDLYRSYGNVVLALLDEIARLKS